MIQAIEDLYIKFLEIRDRGWIRTLKGGFNGPGNTFEILLGIRENYSEYADFKGIEIKTQKKSGRGKIALLNINPKSDKGNPIEIILDKLGYPDKDYPEYKVFNVSLYANEIKKCGEYYLSINVNNRMKRVELYIQDYNNNKLDLNIYWSFSLIQERINKKLNYLAIIKYDEKEDFSKYVKFEQINIYKIKSFLHFLKLLEKGKIRISFKIGLHKEKEQFGQIYNRGVAFDIFEEDLGELYNKIL
jgi:hypothetical protein